LHKDIERKGYRITSAYRLFDHLR